MIVFVEDQRDQEEIERLIKQRKVVKRILMLIKQIREDHHSSGRSNCHRSPIDFLLESYQFYVYRTDNNQVLARGIKGYDAAKDKANQLRKSLNLKWDQVSFKSEKKPTDKPVRQNFGKGIIKQPGEHIYASPSNNLSRIRLQRKDWDEGFMS